MSNSWYFTTFATNSNQNIDLARRFIKVKIMTEKRKYEKPSQKVIKLRQRQQLLVGSNGDIPDNDDYEDGGNPLTF